MVELTFEDLTIVMPVKNEEDSIGKVITQIKDVTKNRSEIIVIDSSTDNSPIIAKQLGAKVYSQPPSGIGEALKLGFQYATGEIIVTIDADGTYPVFALPYIIKYINQGYSVVSINRIIGWDTKMPKLNLFGNLLIIGLVRLLFGGHIFDVTTGMRGFTKSVIQKYTWETNYALSSEMIIKPLMDNMTIKQLVFPYYSRFGSSKLSPWLHGFEIIRDIIKLRLNLK